MPVMSAFFITPLSTGTLLVSRTRDDDSKRSSEQRNIQPRRPVADVVHVHFQAFREKCAVAAVDLPHAGQSGQCLENDSLLVAHFRNLAFKKWPWTNQTHLTLDHVPNLRKLVEAEFAQELSDARDAR